MGQLQLIQFVQRVQPAQPFWYLFKTVQYAQSVTFTESIV